jgi:hypothetical protein
MKIIFRPTTIPWLFSASIEPYSNDVKEIIRSHLGTYYHGPSKTWMVPVDCIKLIEERANELGYTTTFPE